MPQDYVTRPGFSSRIHVSLVPSGGIAFSGPFPGAITSSSSGFSSIASFAVPLTACLGVVDRICSLCSSLILALFSSAASSSCCMSSSRLYLPAVSLLSNSSSSRFFSSSRVKSMSRPWRSAFTIFLPLRLVFTYASSPISTA
jgi:hypothetical protein